MTSPGVFDSSFSRAKRTVVDGQGRFNFAPELGANTIMACNKAGFAEAELEPLNASNIITLQPWSRVEGVLRIGDTLGSNEVVCLWNYPEKEDKAGFFFHLETRTDAQGRFAFDDVPPVGMVVYHNLSLIKNEPDPGTDWEKAIETDEGTMYVTRPRFVESQPTYFQPAPGQMCAVSLGGKGWTIRGEFHPDAPEDFGDWTTNEIHFMSNPTLGLGLNYKDFANDADYEKARQASVDAADAYDRTEAGKREWHNHKNYGITVNDKGNFLIQDVLPGTYLLSIDTSSYGTRNSRWRVRLRKEVVVPEMPAGRERADMDFGTIEIPATAE